MVNAGDQSASTSKRCMFTDIPCEVFIDICKFVPPVDLVTLTTVCKKFRCWLLAPSNFGTEQIWSTSRMTFIPGLKAPPKGISEQCYIFLYLIELGCQFCGAGKMDPYGKLPTEAPTKIYWVFRVRCCKHCLMERTITQLFDISIDQIFENQIFREKIIHPGCLVGVPYIERASRPPIYWKSTVEAANREFVKVNEKDINNWIRNKETELENYNTIAQLCEIPEPTTWNRKTKLESVIRQLISVVPNDARRSEPQVKVELRRCPTYKKYVDASETMKLFTEHHWNKFHDTIYNEYHDRRNYAALRARQYDIFLKVHSLIQKKRYTESDPLVQYLCYCPSFMKPPFVSNNLGESWGINLDDRVLENRLIPQLAQEADIIAHKPKHPSPITTVAGVRRLKLLNRPIFRCKLCVESNADCNILDYKEVCNHLQNKHGITDKNNNNMIIVDYLETAKNHLKRNSNLICFFFPLNE
ncbi:490_t:CDS:2 [Scutellospora calospora]|uniref:490_t:CDS:1 n=1 Tax=Scutellospora calospora TaxID=85575 RepID=A0ACA9JTS2_9GLOM|nr:490_t:CDS:2 [Scutellospora calospora]